MIIGGLQMELIYAAILIHKAGGKIDEATVAKVIEAAGGRADQGKIKSLVAALDGVDIERAIKEAAIPVASTAHAGSSGGEAKKEEKKEEEKVDTEKAAQGLGALFG